LDAHLNPQDVLAELVAGARFAALPEAAIAATKTFLLDTLGVALAGTSHPTAPGLLRTVAGWGEGGEARELFDGTRLPAGSAALINAFLIHGLEFDCVHEAAVVHPMATVASAAMAACDRRADEGRPVDGRALITALALGVDVATSLGMAARGPMRFFRPATAGAFGAVAAVSCLEGFDRKTAQGALGLVYGQISGTLQPHAEGSVLLPLQMGFNARAALNACALAAAGVPGPSDVITGAYGYLRLFENEAFELEPIRALSGDPGARPWRITELSHKPFPCGRLTHGAIDGLARLQAAHGFAAGQVSAVRVIVPPLVHRLVQRPLRAAPEPNDARLCLPFVAAVQLARGRVDVPDFEGTALADPLVHELAKKVAVIADEGLGPNAVVPQRIEVVLEGGERLEVTLEQVLGHPDTPLSRAQQLDKLRRCRSHAARPLLPENIEALIAVIDDLEGQADAAHLVDLVLAP